MASQTAFRDMVRHIVIMYAWIQSVTACPSRCTDRVLITIEDGNIQLVNEIVGKYGLRYLNKISDRIHEYKLTDVSSHSDPCLPKKTLKDIKSQGPGTIRTVYQSEEISVPADEMGIPNHFQSQRYKKQRQKRNLPLHIPLVCSPYYGMDIMEAWKLGYKGEGIVVGIVDTGIEVNHIDLHPNLDQDLSHNFVEGQDPGDVNPDILSSYMELDSESDHGNLMAGLIAAVQGNRFCSSGVSPHAKIAALKVWALNDPSTIVRIFRFESAELEKAVLYKMDHIHIYLNTYGLKKDFAASTAIINDAFSEGVEKGRNGKGSIHIIAAGNKGATKKNANLDGYVNSIYTIAISSVGVNGTLPPFIQQGACILASTFGEGMHLNGDSIVSTSHGNSCVDGIKGTSASAAMAAGIIALVLQANPDLTWRDVQHMIVNTSSLANLEGYHLARTNAAGATYLTWRDVQHMIVNTSSLANLEGYHLARTNAAGATFHPYFGFGLMNASALVYAAKQWKGVPEQHQVIASTVNKGETNTSEVCIQSSKCVSFTEHVTAHVHYVSQYDSLVELKLCSPSTTCSDILTRQGASVNLSAKRISRKWTFMSVQFWGENPKGCWTLSMAIDTDDTAVSKTDFVLKSFSLTVYGYSDLPASDLVDCVHKDEEKTTEKAGGFIIAQAADQLIIIFFFIVAYGLGTYVVLYILPYIFQMFTLPVF